VDYLEGHNLIVFDNQENLKGHVDFDEASGFTLN